MAIDDMPGVSETAGKPPCREDAVEPVKPGDGPVWLLGDGKPFAVVYPAGRAVHWHLAWPRCGLSWAVFCMALSAFGLDPGRHSPGRPALLRKTGR